MNKSIVIIGAGQLGSRHLQACKLLNIGTNIYVVDPSNNALMVAKERYDAIPPNDLHNVQYLNNLNGIPFNIDVAIVATNSKQRSQVINDLLSHVAVKYVLLEKFLFPDLKSYDDISNLLSTKNVKAYVNCPRRMFEYYKKLKNEINDRKIEMVVKGNQWGLGSNAIHFVDLFSFLTNDHDVKLEHEALDDALHESKRPGYVEFTGSLSISNKKGTLQLNSFNAEIAMPEIDIICDSTQFTICESSPSHIKKYDDGQLTDDYVISIPYQSQLTNLVIQQLLEDGTCDLTEYEASATLHKFMLNIFIQKAIRLNVQSKSNQINIS